MNYLNNSALDVLKAIPSVWEEMVALPGSQIGKVPLPRRLANTLKPHKNTLKHMPKNFYAILPRLAQPCAKPGFGFCSFSLSRFPLSAFQPA